ncbi:hypothetical protein GALMADRAFT_145167 [Galerina marginata CBS 339.88]|uniref:DH domain-containing protein n=1 Tax=Galerina marginata (strain CBS 339.88) TaxID=685588 RepID=A0A067SPY3_GALM3|nr:hypothetical protein GALMADRAFT_145167 [Galerina marginata CBS 339.88]
MPFVAERDMNANDELLSSTAPASLYPRCLSLRTKLLRIRVFANYFSTLSNDSQQSSDPVGQLWDLFSYGAPLCYIFDQLPSERGFKKLNNSTFDQKQYDSNPDLMRRRALVLFAMQIRMPIVKQEIPGCEPFTLTDLWDRSSTDGLLKVINTVEAIVDRFPQYFFEETPSSSDMNVSLESSKSDLPAENIVNIITELIETERKYVRDLQSTLICSTALSEANIVDQDEIQLLFPELEKLIDFQIKFLVGLENIAGLPWQEQRWGQHFLENEDGFTIYMAYGFNYTKAFAVVPTIEQNIGPFQQMINDLGGLGMLLVRPISRLCKYSLLLDCLVKQCSPSIYAHYSELQCGADAAKHFVDRLNEAQRLGYNEHIVDGLRSGVQDWKDCSLDNFGELLLDDIIVATKFGIEQEYHVYLFKCIIIFCRTKQNRKPAQGGKSAPLPRLRKTQGTPLVLKGRILWRDVTHVISAPAQTSETVSSRPVFPLCIWWKGDKGLDSSTLHCRTEGQMRKWEEMMNHCIKSVPGIAQDSETETIYSAEEDEFVILTRSPRTATTD